MTKTKRQPRIRRNPTLTGLTDRQKRITIVQDALAWISVMKITKGTYCQDGICPTRSRTDVLTTIKKGRCMVCAKGALLIGTIAAGHKPSIDKLFSAYTKKHENQIKAVDPNTLPGFSEPHLYEIEQAFEGWSGRWWLVYPHARPRLVAILENILRNNGTFRMADIPAAASEAAADRRTILSSGRSCVMAW